MSVRVLRDASALPARPRVARAAPAASEPSRGNRRITPRPGVVTAPTFEPPRAPLRERLAARARALREALSRLYLRVIGPLRVLGRILVALGLVAASVSVVRFVDRYARTSPEFAIDTLTITGNERVPSDELEETMGLAVGDNVFSRSPEELRRALEAHPWIASARVRRRLPRTFEIEVRERHAALVILLDVPYLVDDEGNVIQPLEEGDPTDLPVVTGIDAGRFAREGGYRRELLATSIALTHEWESASLARREPIGEIHVEPDEGLTLFVGADATEVRLGRGPYREKLGRLRRVLDELARRQSRPLYVYLDNVRRPERVTVRVR